MVDQEASLPSTDESLSDGMARRSTSGARRDAVIYFPASLIPYMVSALASAIFTRIFAPGAWGDYTLALSIVQVPMVVLGSWHESATMRFLSAEHGALRMGDPQGSKRKADVYYPAVDLPMSLSVWNAGLFLAFGAVAAAVLSLIVPNVAGLAVTALLFGASTVGLAGLGAIHRALLRAWSLTRSRLITSLGGFLLTFGAVKAFGARPSLLILGPAIATIVAFSILAFELRDKLAGGVRRLLLRPLMAHGSTGSTNPQAGAITAKTYLRYGLPFAGFYAVGWVLNLSDRFLIYGFRGAEEAGVYAPNYSLGSLLIGLVAIPVSVASSARLMQLVGTMDGDTLQEAVKRATRDYILVAVPVFVWVVFAAKDIAGFLLGPEFRTGSGVIAPVAAGTLAWALGMFGNKALERKQHSVTILMLAIVCAALNIGLNLVLVPRFGYVAAAWTTFGAYALYPVLAYLATLRSLRWKIPLRTVVCLLVATAVAYLVVKLGIDRLPISVHLARAALSGVFTVGSMGLVLLVLREIQLSTFLNPITRIWRRLAHRGAGPS